MFSLDFSSKFGSCNVQHCKKNCRKLVFYVSLEQLLPTGGVLSKNCCWKSYQFHRKITVLESFLNKFAGMRTSSFQHMWDKRDSNTCVFQVKFPKFLRAPYSKYICESLLLYLQVMNEKDTANEAELESSQTYMMEFYRENSKRRLALNYIYKKVPS